MKHIVQFSGGVGSWAAAKRVAERYGTKDIVLLFADTCMEDEDLYRFLDDAAKNIGVPITRIADGRNPWEVFADNKYIGNTRADICSRVLKRDLLDRWKKDNCDPENTIIYVGLDWTESHRYENKSTGRGVKASLALLGFRCEAPMCEKPYLTKEQMKAWCIGEGIRLPRLYDLGFPHNNCGGFCVKAGQAQFRLLLESMPERYAYHESEEEKLRETVGDYSVMRDRTGGTTKTLTMKDFRERIEEMKRKKCSAESLQLDLFEWGGCGCAVE
jgi:hypothetical protein